MTKAELQKTIDELNADNNECLVLLDEYMYRQRIIENLINLKDLSKLKGMYLFIVIYSERQQKSLKVIMA